MTVCNPEEHNVSPEGPVEMAMSSLRPYHTEHTQSHLKWLCLLQFHVGAGGQKKE